jgi:hypothetical protein
MFGRFNVLLKMSLLSVVMKKEEKKKIGSTTHGPI